MIAVAKRFLKDERGATAVEYGLIAALIALALVGALSNVSTSINGTMNKGGNNLVR